MKLSQRQFSPHWWARWAAAIVLLLCAVSRCALAEDLAAGITAANGPLPANSQPIPLPKVVEEPKALTAWQIADVRLLELPSEYDVHFDRFVQPVGLLDPDDPMALQPRTVRPVPAPGYLSQPLSTQATADQTLAPVPLPGTVDSVGMTDEDYLRVIRPDLVKPDQVRPNYLRSPSENVPPGIPVDQPLEPADLLTLPMDAPLGFTGPSSIFPREGQTSSHFVPMEDRWRIGMPEWDRYGLNHPPLDDYPYTLGRELDPYHQNVLKGDYPIIGQHTFLNFTGEILADFEGRQVPTPTTPFESTVHPGENDFFGNPNQFFTTDFFLLSFDLFHGDAAFKPVDWRLKFTPVFDFNYLDVEELAVVNPNVKDGTTRFRDWWALQEYFAEVKIADTSPDYDFTSLRLGSQPFLSDFRGFVFQDTNRAIRLFGTNQANREQFNVYYQYWQEKETNSGLNTFIDRPKQTLIMNCYRQDFIWPGYTAQLNFIYDRDKGDMEFDRNDFLVRPDPTGVAAIHSVDSYYLGWTGDGHINRFNVDHAFYWVLGQDTLNPIAGDTQSISAQMAAIELSYDRDWIRFRTSFFFSSGDSKPFDHHATGFDTIIDDPNFAGGGFSYWDRQQIKLLGVNLVQGFSLVPDLRSSKNQGQPNFVNPGLYLGNVGADFDVTPKLRLISNLNLLWFDQTEVLEALVFQKGIDQFIGTDLSLGFEYRPHLNNNIIVVGGVQGLVPGAGFRELYNPIVGNVPALFAGFMNLALKF